MPPTRSTPAYAENETTASDRGGCLSGFLLPPLMVILVGTVLAIFLLNASPGSTLPVMAADASQSTADAQMLAADSAGSFSGSVVASAAGDISPIFMPEVRYWSGKIKAWAAEAGIDPNLVATVMQIESCGYQKALSRAGAIGLFQVMPYHFAAGDSPYDPDTNAARGLDYLRRSLQAANGNVRLALAGYNGGIGVINRPASSWSGQTQGYVAAGTRIYAKASSSNITAEDVQQWTSSNSALCRQAAALEGISP